MTDQELIKKAELVADKLTGIRNDLGTHRHTPTHDLDDAYRNSCVYMRVAQEVVTELKRRAEVA
ncbi:hypothetical protein [Deinococcus kurensis]|uniref:hypothetical protein n=1 Tax=Deinococcus kurensis TaxID=2662757 RepID=UPI0012D3371F|nr:hypothetical protein [Deinococcus kurensis]